MDEHIKQALEIVKAQAGFRVMSEEEISSMVRSLSNVIHNILSGETNDVVVGPWEKLARTQIHVTKTRWLLPQDPMQSLRCSVKIRYRSKAFPATVLPEGDGAVVDCDEPVFGIAPGQSAVFFDGDRLLGGGIIN